MVGNCGCSICGLRGHSKNVTCRNVFPIFDGDYHLESFEQGMSAKEFDGRMFYASRFHVWGSDGNSVGYKTLADTLIEYLQTPNAKIENLKVLLCVHQWVQDEGTETV
jgi:hypothetical protein